jgi:hypothetical protein
MLGFVLSKAPPNMKASVAQYKMSCHSDHRSQLLLRKVMLGFYEVLLEHLSFPQELQNSKTHLVISLFLSSALWYSI